MTAKEIANDIAREKYKCKSKGDIAVICDNETRKTLEESRFVVRREDKHPGAIIRHSTVCGISLYDSKHVPLSEAAKGKGYEVVTVKECIKRQIGLHVDD